MIYATNYTLNDYPFILEPGIPSLDDRLTTFLNLSRRIGLLCMVWRYDPIIISNLTPFEYHRERFTWIAKELRGATNRVMISIVHFYQKTERRLSQLEREGVLFDWKAASSPSMVNQLKDLGTIARKQGMEIFTCAQQRDWSDIGIPPGRCIDESLVNRIWGFNLQYKKDTGQRSFCRCTVSKDIGVNDTCIHACPYCYSTRDYALAGRHYNEHDPTSPAILGYHQTLKEGTRR